jgi:hypothetical protein
MLAGIYVIGRSTGALRTLIYCIYTVYVLYVYYIYILYIYCIYTVYLLFIYSIYCTGRAPHWSAAHLQPLFLFGR